MQTLDAAPVRLFGWVTEKGPGVTYEALGINGAEASIFSRWDEELLLSNLAERFPALIVVSYGTNEAGHAWSYEKYYEVFWRLLLTLRRGAPAASILVVGPPDRGRGRRRGFQAAPGLDLIIRAQREAAVASGCAFWDTRSRMGGEGSIKQWMLAGLAGSDSVHFSSDGYRTLGASLYEDLMHQ